jgi:hypothetical protein
LHTAMQISSLANLTFHTAGQQNLGRDFLVCFFGVDLLRSKFCPYLFLQICKMRFLTPLVSCLLVFFGRDLKNYKADETTVVFCRALLSCFNKFCLHGRRAN